MKEPSLRAMQLLACLCYLTLQVCTIASQQHQFLVQDGSRTMPIRSGVSQVDATHATLDTASAIMPIRSGVSQVDATHATLDTVSDSFADDSRFRSESVLDVKSDDLIENLRCEVLVANQMSEDAVLHSRDVAFDMRLWSR